MFTYDKNNKGYYITYNHISCFSLAISRKINMRIYEFHYIMVNNYHGCLELIRIIGKNNRVFFRTEIDVQNAIEWLNSFLIIKKLAGDK